ncbi:MAG: family 16 glycoside hydrolase [Phycisphaerae bacterium]|jgi:hypothetical protein
MSRFARLPAAAALAGLILYSGITAAPLTAERVWVDASRPLAIEPPFDVVPIGPEGERGLWIGPNVGRGWKKEAGGSATYQFEVAQAGEYWLWAYCLWHDACTNAIYAQVDGMPAAILGNDPLFGQWHWVRGFAVRLKAGPHRLVLSNHSDNLAVRQLFLTDSPTDHPDRGAPSFVELFYEGFDGCDNGDFAAWRQQGGQWFVEHPQEVADKGKKVLIGRCDGRALITMNGNEWGRYDLSALVKLVAMNGPGSSAQICFGLSDGDNYYALQLQDSGRADVVQAQLVRRRGGVQSVLAAFESPWQAGAWHDVEIDNARDALTVRIDGVKRGCATDPTPVGGGIGLRLEGKAEAHFDDVHVRVNGQNAAERRVVPTATGATNYHRVYRGHREYREGTSEIQEYGLPLPSLPSALCASVFSVIVFSFIERPGEGAE